MSPVEDVPVLGTEVDVALCLSQSELWWGVSAHIDGQIRFLRFISLTFLALLRPVVL